MPLNKRMIELGIPRYLRTVWHLRASQLLWRIRSVLERAVRSRAKWLNRSWDYRGLGPPPLRNDLPDLPVFYCVQPHGKGLLAALSTGEFAHFNRCWNVGHETPDWQLGPCAAHRFWMLELYCHPWAFNLAKITESRDESSDQATALLEHYVSDWIRRCGPEAPGAYHLAWNSFVVASRLTWWIRAYRALGDQWLSRQLEFRESLLRSLWMHAAFLHDHIEWDLRANHLFRDAVGLAWSGRFFSGTEPKLWLKTATALAVDQVEEQILLDGGHFERSPMYHLQVMEELLSLGLLLEDSDARSVCLRAWRLMADCLEWLRHPDGDIVSFNDTALRAQCSPDDMLRFARLIGDPVDVGQNTGGRYLKNTGIVAFNGLPWSVFLDVGELGPNYQAGHAHADTLTFECSYRGQRLFVDPGTYGYDNDERRVYDRSTRAHNTVTVDDTDSSEVWHIFRTGRRARPANIDVALQANQATVLASHDGYDHLPGRPRHTRRLTVTNGGALTITDHLSGEGTHAIEGGLLLAPEWRASVTSGGWLLTRNGQGVRVSIADPRELQLAMEARFYHPEFGKECETTRLTWRLRQEMPVEVRIIVEEDV